MTVQRVIPLRSTMREERKFERARYPAGGEGWAEHTAE